MDQTIKARLNWVKLYEEKQDAGYVCRYCGISRPTLRKWYKRVNVQLNTPFIGREIVRNYFFQKS